MNVEDFDYDLPETSIAQTPLEQRDDARLLVALDVDEIVDRRVRDLAEFVRPGDVVVMNSTRVLPARIHLQRPSGGAAEILLLNPLGEPTTGDGGGMEQRWEVLAKPGRKLADGMTLVVPTAVASSELVVTMGAALGEGRREAVLEAATLRLRPILMTTLASILGAIPTYCEHSMRWGRCRFPRTCIRCLPIRSATKRWWRIVRHRPPRLLRACISPPS